MQIWTPASPGNQEQYHLISIFLVITAKAMLVNISFYTGIFWIEVQVCSQLHKSLSILYLQEIIKQTMTQ